MNKIAVFTTTRSEFGLLSGLIKEIEKCSDIEYLLFAGGGHLSKDSGRTIEEILDAKIKITAEFDYLMDGDSEEILGRSFAVAVDKLTEIFNNYSFDAVCILGDRFELLAVTSIAILFRQPIIHIHGGESSEGVMDEQIRHMITKAAHLHFVACEEYANNIKQMGESSWRIYNTGTLAVDNIQSIKKITKKKLYNDLHLTNDKPLVILTYHPQNLSNEKSFEIEINSIFKALDHYQSQVIITTPGVEAHRTLVERLIKQQVDTNRDYHYIKSLGIQKYYSLLPYCTFLIGNSSSGIIDAPYFKIPSINVGSRQDGRLRHLSVIDTPGDVNSILEAIKIASSNEFRKSLRTMTYKFGDGNSAKRMVKILKEIKIDSKLLTKQLDFPE